MLVIFFFIFMTASIFLSGLLLPRFHRTTATQAMGRGLMLTGIAFAVWSLAVLIKPDQDALHYWVGIGTVPFIVALIFFLQAAVNHLPAKTQRLCMTIGIIYALVLFVTRTILTSDPGFSADGLFFFQPHDIVKFMYIVMMVAVILPAVQTTATDIHSKDVLTARILTGSLIANTIGGILLLVSVMDVQDTLMYLVGWGMMIATLFLLLASLGVFHRRPALQLLKDKLH